MLGYYLKDDMFQNVLGFPHILNLVSLTFWSSAIFLILLKGTTQLPNGSSQILRRTLWFPLLLPLLTSNPLVSLVYPSFQINPDIFHFLFPLLLQTTVTLATACFIPYLICLLFPFPPIEYGFSESKEFLPWWLLSFGLFGVLYYYAFNHFQETGVSV